MDEDVVDEGALRGEQGGVVGLAVLEARGVVHGDVLHGGQGARAAELDLAHVGDVKEAHGGADGEVLGNEAAAGTRVLDRHVQPPKSTILALRVRWVALSGVFFNSAATGVAEAVMGRSSGSVTTIGIGWDGVKRPPAVGRTLAGGSHGVRGFHPCDKTSTSHGWGTRQEAGPSTPLGAKDAPNSAQDDRFD